MATNEPSSANVDYNSPEWFQGFGDGKAGRPFATPHAKGTQPHFNYLEGWLMGDFERMSAEDAEDGGT